MFFRRNPPDAPAPTGQTAPAPADPRTDGLRRTLRLVLLDSLASETMGTLTSGVFLAGFAVALDASNFMIGVLAAIPFLVQFLQLPAVLLVERLRRRRVLSVVTSAIARIFILAVAATPLLPHGAAIMAVAALVAINQGFSAVAGCAWNSWMRDVIPERIYGRFFSRRNFATTGLSMVLSLSAGVLIAAWKRRFPSNDAYAYSALFVVGGLFGLLGVYILARTPEPPMTPVTEKFHPYRLLTEPFHDGNFRRLIAFLATWSFSVNLASPFLTVYMLRTLGLPMSRVVLFNVISQVCNLAFLNVWGRLGDRYGSQSVLQVASPLFLACLLVWSVTGQPYLGEMLLPLLVLLHMLMGVATGGVALATGTIAMKLSPIGRATSYLAANSVVTSISASLASLAGGACADFFAARELSLSITWKGPAAEVGFQALTFHSWTFFFALAFALGLIALRLLRTVEERGEVREAISVQELIAEARRSAANLSSVAGLNKLGRFPFAQLWSRRRRALTVLKAPPQA
ncbi:MAG: MFS transporter [Alphaproteobacteria bacterium]|nr:MFS transporter [Alphaproteobacteria bacterium]